MDNTIDIAAQTSAARIAWDGVHRSYIPPAKLAIAPELGLHTAAAQHVDPITYEVLRNSLVATNFEHGALLQQLCVSPVVIFARDFQTALLSETGELVCMGPNLAYFANCSALIAKWIMENRSANPGIAEGDMWFSNDPYVGSPHQPDACIAAPVFADGALFGWVCNIIHYLDVGGPRLSQNVDAQDVWNEAPLIPPVKIVENRRLREDVMNIFVRQSRMPLMIATDLRAAIAAAERARGKIERLILRYGAMTVKGVMRGMLDAGETLFANRLETIPDGRWSHRAYTESAVSLDRAVYRYQINITKRGGELTVDNDGTDSQAGAINLVFGPFSGAVFSALTAQLTPELAGAFGGVYRRVSFNLEPGRLTSPEHPGAVSPAGSFNAMMSIYCAAMTVGKMVSCSRDIAVRNMALGASIPHFYATLAVCFEAAGQMSFLMGADGMIGSIGAMPARDGIEAGGHAWIPEAIAPNIEHYEMECPVLYLYRRYLPGGADGAGRTRGGRGLEIGVTVHGQATRLHPEFSMNESFTKAQGQWGGAPGSRGAFKLRLGGGVDKRLPAGDVPQSLADVPGEYPTIVFKPGPLPTLKSGDMFEWTSPTTAGWGDPLNRDPVAVAHDVETGNCGERAAGDVYGIVLTDGVPDLAATAIRRHQLRAARLGRAPSRSPGNGTFAGDFLRLGERLIISGGHIYCDCGERFGPAEECYKLHAQLTRTEMTSLGQGHETDDPEMTAGMEFRIFDCPGCGSRLDTEIALKIDPLLHDTVLFTAAGGIGA